MQREIKFRAWDKSENKLYPVEQWSNNSWIAVPVQLSEDDWQLEQRPMEDVTLMQFTGLKDKNGKEIYEGDVVKILYTDWPSCHGCHSDHIEHMEAIAQTKVVIWSVQGFYVSHKVDGYAESMEPGRHGFNKVIGNIYENPTLLSTPN